MNSYRRQVLPSIPRALALLNQAELDPARGGFDRTFWQYRTISNFPGAGRQRLVLALALVLSHQAEDNPWAEDPGLLAACLAGLGYWARIQHRDGSFDEWFRNEHSFCATAFTFSAMAQSLLILGDRVPPARRQAALAALNKAGRWLADRSNPQVMNQNLAAAVGLLAMGRLSGEASWDRLAQDKLAVARRGQNPEGWFAEYQGADLGYCTLSLDLLAMAHQLGRADMVWEMAQSLSGFLRHTAGLSGPWLAGRLGSRGTSHVFPFGAQYFADQIPAARDLAGKWRAAHADGLLPGPGQVDDYYFSYFYLPQFALAATLDLAVADAPSDFAPRGFNLAGSGFTAVHLGKHCLLVSARLGGSLALLRVDAPPLYNLGYRLATDKGRVYASATWREGGAAQPDPEAGLRFTDLPFTKVSMGQPLVKHGEAFHLFTRFLGITGQAEAFQLMVKKRMIQPGQGCGIHLDRTISVADSRITVRDVIRGSGGPTIKQIVPAATIAMQSPSARQDPGGLLFVPGWDGAQAALDFTRHGRIELGWAIDLSHGVSVGGLESTPYE